MMDIQSKSGSASVGVLLGSIPVRFGSVRFRFGSVRTGSVRFHSVQSGSVQSSSNWIGLGPPFSAKRFAKSEDSAGSN